jgi:hypothetical protein
MTIIYGIYDNSNDQLLYIGSTQYFEKRRITHLCNITCNNTNSNIPLYKYIRDNNLNIDIRKIQTNNISKDEAAIIENQLINQLNPLMNVRKAYNPYRDVNRNKRSNYYFHKKYINNEINDLLNIVY